MFGQNAQIQGFQPACQASGDGSEKSDFITDVQEGVSFLGSSCLTCTSFSFRYLGS